MLLVPLTMGFFYLAIAYPRFTTDPLIISQHLFVLAFWLFTTFLFMMIARNTLIKLHFRFVILPTVIIPVLSCYLLFLIYVSSVIGNVYWDSTPSYIQILPFLPHLFELGDNFRIPRALIVAFFTTPLVVFALIFQGRVRDMIIWHWSLQETYVRMEPRRKLYWTIFAIASWAMTLAFFLTADPSINGFLNFNHDPVVTFFKRKPALFAMTKERVFWVQRDKKADDMTQGHVPRVHNVFLFVIDALRADHLPSYGYSRPLTPFLTKFLRINHSRQVDLALSTGLETITGTICLMTSKEPAAMSQFNYTLPDYFHDQGFRTQLLLAGDHHWQLQHDAFGRKIDLFYDGSEHPGPQGICDDELVVNKIDELNPDDGGYHFFYIHLVSVHPLGVIEDEYLQYKPIRSVIIDDNPFFGNSVNQVVNLYDDRILQMDGMMKKILSSLRQKGYLRDYIAVLTADHGQILGEKNKYGHGRFADIGGIRIPMIYFGSKPLPPLAESRFGVQIDIAPTLADMAGIEYPSCWQGQSLLRPRTNPWSYHLSPYTHAKQEGAVVYYSPGKILKYSRPLDDTEDGPRRLYDLAKDPNELNNLIDGFDPKFLGRIRSQANEHFTSY